MINSLLVLVPEQLEMLKHSRLSIGRRSSCSDVFYIELQSQYVGIVVLLTSRLNFVGARLKHNTRLKGA